MTEHDAEISGLGGRVASLEADLAVASAHRRVLLAACNAALEELLYGNSDIDYLKARLRAAIAEATGQKGE